MLVCVMVSEVNVGWKLVSVSVCLVLCVFGGLLFERMCVVIRGMDSVGIFGLLFCLVIKV